MRKEAWHTQRRDRASGVPLEILEHLLPKPESAYFLLCAFTYTSDFMGGCPPLPLSEKELTQGSQVANIKATIYTNYINQYTARDTAGKGYGDLAANIGPTSENPFTNTISNQSFNCSKESVFRQFRTSHASHSLEALSNHMWPEKPIQAG